MNIDGPVPTAWATGTHVKTGRHSGTPIVKLRVVACTLLRPDWSLMARWRHRPHLLRDPMPKAQSSTSTSPKL